jgi:hypothetical protein
MVETLLSVEVNATDRGATVVISVDAIECQAFSHHWTAETSRRGENRASILNVLKKMSFSP